MEATICLLLMCQIINALEISGGPEKIISKQQGKQEITQTKMVFNKIVQALSVDNWQEKVKPFILAESALAENTDAKDRTSLINDLGYCHPLFVGRKISLKDVLVFRSQYRISGNKQLFKYQGVETCAVVSGKLSTGVVACFAFSFFVKDGRYLLWRFDDETDL